MATPSTDPPRQSWSALTALARESQPATDPDVRAGVRRAISGIQPVREIPATGIFTDLIELSRSGWFRGALAGVAAITFFIGWEVIGSSTEALMAMDLQGAFASL